MGIFYFLVKLEMLFNHAPGNIILTAKISLDLTYVLTG